LATLVVFAREMEAILTDAALVMFDKMLGGVFRRAYRAYRENVVHRAKALDASTRALLHMAKAMLAAKASGEDQVAAVERSLGWERLKSAAQSSTPTTRAFPSEPRAFTRRLRQRRIVSSLIGMPIRLIKRSPGRPPAMAKR
jgi:hypothetical protein